MLSTKKWLFSTKLWLLRSKPTQEHNTKFNTKLSRLVSTLQERFHSKLGKDSFDDFSLNLHNLYQKSSTVPININNLTVQLE